MQKWCCQRSGVILNAIDWLFILYFLCSGQRSLFFVINPKICQQTKFHFFATGASAIFEQAHSIEYFFQPNSIFFCKTVKLDDNKRGYISFSINIAGNIIYLVLYKWNIFIYQIQKSKNKIKNEKLCFSKSQTFFHIEGKPKTERTINIFCPESYFFLDH